VKSVEFHRVCTSGKPKYVIEIQYIKYTSRKPMKNRMRSPKSGYCSKYSMVYCNLVKQH